MPRVQATNRVIQNVPYSIYFDGSKKLALTTMGNLGSGLTGAFSFGLWVFSNSKLTTAQYLVGETNIAGGTFLLSGITRTAAKVGMWNVQLRDHTGRTLSVEVSSKVINDGAWHFLVYTKTAANNPAGIKTYIDRVDTSFDTLSNTGFADPANFSRKLAIGAIHGDAGATNFFNGYISRPYFFQRVLTQTEIDDWFYKGIIPTTPYAGYPMSAGAGVIVADVNGTYGGTLDNANMWNEASPRKPRSLAAGRV